MHSFNWRFFGVKDEHYKLGISVVLTALAAAFVGWMYHNQFVADPYNPELTGTSVYGHNGAGSFNVSAVFVAIELFALLATLLPYSYSRYYWVRPLVLQFVFGCWLFLMAVSSMHGGGVQMRHVLWVFAVNVFIFILLVASIIAEAVNTKRHRAMQIQQWNQRPNN